MRMSKKKNNNNLRYSSNRERLIKFRSYPLNSLTGVAHRKVTSKMVEDQSPPWKLSLPNSKETIKLDDMTVSLHGMRLLHNGGGSARSIHTSHVPHRLGDILQPTPKDDANPNANSSSQDDSQPSGPNEAAYLDPEQDCVPMGDWQTTFKPTCNSLHEMDMTFLLNEEVYSLVSDQGFWRDAWNVDMKVSENGMSPVSNIVIKSLKYIHDPNEEMFELNRVDGVSLEHLTQSRYITDIYGYCGTTSLQEFAGGSFGGYLEKLSSLQKLFMAAFLAAGVADVHEIGNNNNAIAANIPSLIHNDINMGNILLGEQDGEVVPLLHDFNIAIFRKKDAATGESCRLRSRFYKGQWYAPEQMKMFPNGEEEEYSVSFIDEKIDVYALGNILYKIAVGKSPWKYNYDTNEIGPKQEEGIRKAKLKGRKPRVPDEIKKSDDPSIQALLEAMDRCYRNDPDVRASAREVADYLSGETVAIVEANKAAGRRS